MRSIFVIGVLLLAACAGPKASAGAVEIRDYQGEKLGSIGDFRENSVRGPQQVDSAQYRLRVTGFVRETLSLGLVELNRLPQVTRVVTLDCVEGWSVRIKWDGFEIARLLDSAGVDSAVNTVIFHAVDGYTTSLPLAFVRERNLILAHKMNDVVLPPARGYPFELVAEDKWGYKWIRWVDGIELSTDSLYRGFWEQKGYDNNGDLTGPKLEPKQH